MARLSSPDGRRNRGQLLLVGAFALAILLVGLAVILNGVTHAEVLAAAGDDARGGREALRFEADAHRAAAGLVGAVNRRNDTGYTALRKALNRSVNRWETLAARQMAADGAGTTIALNDTVNGTRIYQDNASRNLTNEDGNATWRLTPSVQSTRGFRLNLSRTSLADGPCDSECFRVIADPNGSAIWRLNVTGNATHVTVTVDGPAASGTCTAATDYARIDLAGGTLNDESCPALAFASGLDSPYHIRYQNGNRAVGTYRLVVKKPHGAVTGTGNYADDTTGDPRAVPAIYAASVTITYRTPDAHYAADLRVAPGENDADD